MANNAPPLEDWTADKVTKIFDYHLDDMHPLDAITAREKYTTVEEKRSYLIEVEKRYIKSFK